MGSASLADEQRKKLCSTCTDRFRPSVISFNTNGPFLERVNVQDPRQKKYKGKAQRATLNSKPIKVEQRYVPPIVLVKYFVYKMISRKNKECTSVNRRHIFHHQNTLLENNVQFQVVISCCCLCCWKNKNVDTEHMLRKGSSKQEK